jgi:hypothetical protein
MLVKTSLAADLINKRREQVSEEARKAGVEFHKALVETAPNGKLPEPLFVTEFLPYFSGQPVNNKNEVMRNWMIISGSPSAEVDIIDRDGKTLYKVPSLFDTNAVSISKNVSLRTIVLTADLKRGGLPQIAENYLDSAIGVNANSIIEVDRDTAFTVEARDRWNKIINRYYPQTPIENIKAETKKLEHNPDDELVSTLPKRR